MVSKMLKKIIPYTLVLYAVSLLTSMAGMEVFGWLTFLLTCVLLYSERQNPETSKVLHFFTPADAAALVFLAVVLLAPLVNTPEPYNYWDIIGRGRWVLLFIGLRYALLLTKVEPTEKIIRVVFYFACGVSVYALFQHFTGIDLLHETNIRIEFTGQTKPFPAHRSIGMFNSSMTFANSFAVFLSLPFAFFILAKKSDKKMRRLASLTATLAGLAVFSTFTRSGWLGGVFGILACAFIYNRKVFLGTVLAISFVVGLGVTFNPAIQTRFLTLFNPSYGSNSERVTMWKANYAIFKDYPLLGIGYWENERVVTDYYKKLGITDGFGGHAHNNFFQFLSGTGLVGTLAFYLFCISLFIYSWRLWQLLRLEESWQRPFVLGSMGAQVALHFGGIGECTFKDAEINHQLMLIFAMTLAIYYWRIYRPSYDRT